VQLIRRRNKARRVYRSRSQWIAGIVGLVVYGLIEVGTIAHTRHSTENVLLQGIVLLFIIFICGKLICLTVVSRDEGLHVVNMFSTFDLGWNQIDRFEVGRSGILPGVCRIYMKDGEIRSGIGISEAGYYVTPGGPAGRMVEELNKELTTHREPRETPVP